MTVLWMPLETVLYVPSSIDSGTRVPRSKKVDVRLPGKGNSNSHGAGPVHQIIPMIKWTRTSRLSIKNSLSLPTGRRRGLSGRQGRFRTRRAMASIWRGQNGPCAMSTTRTPNDGCGQRFCAASILRVSPKARCERRTGCATWRLPAPTPFSSPRSNPLGGRHELMIP